MIIFKILKSLNTIKFPKNWSFKSIILYWFKQVNKIIKKEPPFSITRVGWGTFDIKAIIKFKEELGLKNEEVRIRGLITKQQNKNKEK